MKTTRSIIIRLIVTVSLAVSIQSGMGQVLVTNVASDFEIDADGWTGTNNAAGTENLFYLAGGATSNSVGYVKVHENTGDAATMYFVAPTKFLGDKRSAYNGILRFALRREDVSDLYEGDDVF